MPQTSLSSLLHSWELNTCLYVISNTMYKDRGVSLFFSIFIITASNPCQSYRCPEESACYHNDTHFTCVSHAQEDSNRKNGEIFSSTVIFQFPWCSSAIRVRVRVLFTVLESFVLRHLLTSYSAKVNKNSLKHQKYFIFALQAPAGPLPYIPH